MEQGESKLDFIMMKRRSSSKRRNHQSGTCLDSRTTITSHPPNANISLIGLLN
jgi:hypothetical protein